MFVYAPYQNDSGAQMCLFAFDLIPPCLSSHHPLVIDANVERSHHFHTAPVSRYNFCKCSDVFLREWRLTKARLSGHRNAGWSGGAGAAEELRPSHVSDVSSTCRRVCEAMNPFIAVCAVEVRILTGVCLFCGSAAAAPRFFKLWLWL